VTGLESAHAPSPRSSSRVRGPAATDGRRITAEPQPPADGNSTRLVAELFNLGYETLLWLLTRFFTRTDETGGQLHTLTENAFAVAETTAAVAARLARHVPPALHPT